MSEIENYRVVEARALRGAAPLDEATHAWNGVPPGAHVITSRRGYLHHGIYVGGGQLIHYSGWARGWHRGPVEEIPLGQFMSGDALWVRCRAPHHFDPAEVIRRARSRIGEDHYRIFTNNCEHFCEWCLHGEHRSYQVEAMLALPARILAAAVRLIARSQTSDNQTEHVVATRSLWRVGIRVEQF